MKTPNFRVIQIIYSTLLFGVFAFFVFIFNNVSSSSFNYNDKTIFSYLVPFVSVIGIFLSNFLFNKSILNILETDSLFQKLTKYQLSNIMRGAPLEAVGLFSVVIYSLTSNYYYLIYTILSVIIMLYYFPSKNKFKKNVILNIKEKEILNRM